MAWMNQEKKATIKAELDKVLTGTGVKYSLAVRHHTGIVCTLRSGPIDFLSECPNFAEKYGADSPRYARVNEFYVHEHFTGKSKELLQKVVDALNTGNHDRSDLQSDYFDVGHYVHLNIGEWDKPYTLTGA